MRYELKKSHVRFCRWVFGLSAALFLSPAVLLLAGVEELGWEAALSSALLWLLMSLSIWRVVFRPHDDAIELTDQGIASLSSSRAILWKEVARLRASRLSQRLELVAGDGTRVRASYHLEGFADVLRRTLDSMPECLADETPEWAVSIPHWLRGAELAFLAAWLGLVVFFWLEGQSVLAAVAMFCVLLAVWIDRDEVRAVSCNSGQLQIATRRGVRTIPVDAVTVVRLLPTREQYGALALRVTIAAGGEEMEVVPPTVDPILLFQRISRSLPR